ncbi:MAG: hypothetical protein K2X00_22780 [Nitrospiraceae bacterium]|nr:hypothetical protein [Nitrospiraceae bacterium]
MPCANALHIQRSRIYVSVGKSEGDMDYSDFSKLSGILRADLREARKAKSPSSACLFQMIQAFQDYSARERPKTYKSFVEFAAAYHPIYEVPFSSEMTTARAEVGRKCEDAKKAHAGDFVTLMLFYQWTRTRSQFEEFMESARDLDPFVAYFLKGGKGRENASKRGVMKRIDINSRVPINLIDWEIANRRVEQEKKERTNKISFYNLFIDSVPDQAMFFEDLTHLSVCSTLVTTVEPFGALKNLQVLDCSYIQLDSLNGLSVSNLEQLFCGVTNVEDIAILKDAHKLKRLYMGSTYIADLSPLRNCPELEFLSCEDTNVSSLDGLENCTKLNYVDCSDTGIRNLDPIAALPNLEDVIFNGCHIDASLERLCSLPSLKKLIFFQGTAEGIPTDVLSRESYENCLSRLREFYRQRRKLDSSV